MTLRFDETGFGNIGIYQAPEEFCYGVDAVLLADFAARAARKRKKNCRIMDLGTGTGIVPLILSHKTEAGYIGCLEVQEHSFALVEKNVAHNHLEERIVPFHGDVSCFAGEEELAGTFDVVTTNPPYFIGGGGLESKNPAKAIARRETTGTLDDFLRLAAKLLRDKGDFYMVHRPDRLIDIAAGCRKYKLEPKELRFVSGKPMEKPNILLVHCVKYGNPELRVLPPLAVHKDDGSYTEEILNIYEKGI